LVAGIQKRTLWRNAPLDWLPFGQKRTYWIPAIKGMTRVGKLVLRHMRLPWRKVLLLFFFDLGVLQ
jgi:hypothetical protein